MKILIVSDTHGHEENLERVVEKVGKIDCLMTHGHYYGVSVETSMLKEEALARGCNVALYGHTHRPDLEIESEITVLNPGSLSYPRQHGRKPSYAIMEIDEKGIAHYDIYYLESCK